MAQMIDLDLSPDQRKLRQFGFIAFAAFGLLAACAFYETWMFASGLGEKRTTIAAILGGLSGFSLLAGLAFPAANRPLYVALTLVAFPIGFVLSYVILGFLFFGVIAPIGLAIRLFGGDPMQRRHDRAAASYWSRSARTRPLARYFRQF